MRTLIPAVLLLTIGMLPGADRSEPSVLIEQLRNSGRGESPFHEHENVAKQLQAHGGSVIPLLLPLLQEEHAGVRYVAGAALADCEGLTDEHLDVLIASHRRETFSQIPLAIAKVGTPRAVKFLIDELLHARDPDNSNVAAALHRLGEKAVPSLVRIYQTHDKWDVFLETNLFFLFARLEGKAHGAIEPLSQIVNDASEPDAKRFRALKALGAIGPPALVLIVKSGNGLLATPPSVHEAGDPSTTALLLCGIAALRERGTFAGPLVTSFLGSKEWEVRVEAARALGWIGYHGAAEELIAALQQPDDWRLVFSAAESLAMLKSERALSRLADVSERHWYAPVRQMARDATKSIRTRIRYEPKKAVSTMYDLFNEQLGSTRESLSEQEADKLQLPALPPPPQIEVKIRSEDGSVRMEKRTGVEVSDGYLIGTDLGEFGGDISFVDHDGNLRVLRHEQTQTIYKTADGIFSVGGLAHMDGNTGFICKATKAGGRGWTVEKWRVLPGAPRFSRLLKDGRLFVSCHGGIVVVAPDGEMKSMSRRECLPEARDSAGAQVR